MRVEHRDRIAHAALGRARIRALMQERQCVLQLQTLHLQARDAASETVDHRLEALDLVLQLREIEDERAAREKQILRRLEQRDGQILAADGHVIADLVEDARQAGLRRERERERMRVAEILAAANVGPIDRVYTRVCGRRQTRHRCRPSPVGARPATTP